jgi:hypothetical protein
MRKETIKNNITTNILKNLDEGQDIDDIKKELFVKIHKFVRIISSDPEINVYELLTHDPDTIGAVRTRCQVIYINECNRYINDLSWIIQNKNKFPKLSNYSLFKLILLKERLSIEKKLF